MRAPLAQVPENTMKFIVGVMLTSFGMFWGAEGAGAQWPGADRALLVLIPAVAVFALGLVGLLRRGDSSSGPADRAGRKPVVIRRISAFAAFWYDFIVGDDWRLAVGVIAALILTYAVATTTIPAWWVLPAAVAVLLTVTGQGCLRVRRQIGFRRRRR
jgi:uncharacterized membrane protein